MRYILAIVLLTGAVNAQTIHVTEQNVIDLNPEAGALAGTEGAQRIKATFWGGGNPTDGFSLPFDVTAALPIRLTIKSTVDDYTVSVLSSATSTPPNTVWWVIPFLSAGSYRLQATAVLPGDSVPVFDRYLTVTSAPSAQILNITNTVIAGNIESGAVQVAVTVQNPSNVVMSLVPAVPYQGVVGTETMPWGEFNAGTGRVFKLIVAGDLDVSGAISAVDTGKVSLLGDTMIGGLTNEAGFFGDGAGLTNLNVTGDGVGYTNLSSSGTGNVVTNIIEAAGGIEYQRGEIVSGGLTYWQEGSASGVYWLAVVGTVTGGGNVVSAGLYIQDNGAVSLLPSDGTALHGGIRGPGAVDLSVDKSNAAHIPSAVRGVSIGAYRATVGGTRGNGVLGGDNGSYVISGGIGSWIIGGGAAGHIISSSGRANIMLGPGGSADQILGTAASSLIAASGGFNVIAGSGFNNVNAANYNTRIATTNMAGAVAMGGYDSAITGTGAILGQGSAMFAHYGSTNRGEATFSVGAYIDNTNRGSTVFSDTSSTTRFRTMSTNQFLIRAQGGVGIGTNNPAAQLHVNGDVQIIGVKLVASGTNLYLTDGATYTNLVTTTPL